MPTSLSKPRSSIRRKKRPGPVKLNPLINHKPDPKTTINEANVITKIKELDIDDLLIGYFEGYTSKVKISSKLSEHKAILVRSIKDKEVMMEKISKKIFDEES